MASTGTAVFPSTSLFPDTTLYPGQGTMPFFWVLLSFDDVSSTSPNWTDVTSKLWAVSTARGRDSEFSQIDAGTATVVLDNRRRDFDPTYASSPYYPNVRPLNRVWIREQFTGETQDIFKGYVESYQQEWPSGDWSNAQAVISASDEFKVLVLDKLPTTNPPRNSYGEVVAADKPDGYWSFDDDPAQLAIQPEPVSSPVDSPVETPELYEDPYVLGALPGKKRKKRRRRR